MHFGCIAVLRLVPQELVKLGIQLWMDGAASAESFQDAARSSR